MMRTLNRHKYKTGRRFFRGLISLGIVIAIIMTYHTDVLSDVSMTQYTAYPPFIGTVVKPNVLINLDTSTSLGYFAYDFDYNAWTAPKETSSGSPRPVAPSPSTGYSSSNTYYGYFDSNKYYTYNTATKEFEASGDKSLSKAAGEWDGNFLNWLTMRRADIIKKALIGGKTKYRAEMITVDTDPHAHCLVAETPYADSVYLGYQKEVPASEIAGYIPSANITGSDPEIFTFDNDEVYRTGGGRRSWKLLNDVPAFSIGTLYDGGNPNNIFKVVIHLYNEPKGVIQRVGDNVRWGLEVMNNGYDTSDGMMVGGTSGCHGGGDETGGSRGGGGHRDSGIIDVAGGTVLVPIGYDNIVDKEIVENGVTVTVRGMVTEIAIAAPYTPATPIAESLWTATGYFMQYDNGLAVDSDGPRYFTGATNRGQWGRGGRWGSRSNAASYPVGDDVDPYNYAFDPATDTPLRTPCANSYVITITDGEPTADRNVDITMLSDAFNSGYTNGTSPLPGWEGSDYFWQLDGSHYIDEVALYGHADPGTSYRDLRDGSTNTGAVLDGEQYLTHYFIYAHFGSGTPNGKRLLNYSGAAGGGAARNGGFIDSNGGFLPDQTSEYDADLDGNNDTFFNVEDGNQLEAALTNAVFEIVKHASSGTATSMLSNTADGEGAVYQAFFYAEKEEGTEKRKWLGYMQALFVDKYGNLREDTVADSALDTYDNVIKMNYSAANGTEIYKCPTSNNGKTYSCPSTAATGGLDSISPLWDGGKFLWKTAPANRTIFTTTDGSTRIDFETAKSLTLQAYLRAADQTEAVNIIDWIRGKDITGYRKRDLTININGTNVTDIWKLGDIIHSTPTVVGKPVENYDLLYGDGSYTGFRSYNLKRRQVVYVGANDGMLHAFNAGCYNAAEHKYYPDVDSNGNCVTGTTYSLGEELWAFVPRGLLPHLKWLTAPGYTHVYYVDLKPKITDVKIFNDTTHKNGWGTILIGGFRYGGKDISWTSGLNSYKASPEYFAIDITDPLNPRLLWTFSDSDFDPDGIGLGLSMTYPSVAKIGTEWFVIFGSGATDYDVNSNLTGFQSGNIFVLNISGGNNGVISKWTEKTNFWKKSTNATVPNDDLTFMADPITVDVDIDYDVDVIYFGENYKDTSGWNALLHRITTNKGVQTDPALWKMSTVGNINNIAGSKDVAKRITAAPSVAMDDSANLWVFFGTGQFLGSSDKNQTDTGAFYAIRDGCWAGETVCTTSYTNLMNISDASVNVNGTVNINNTNYSWPALLNESANYDGWAMYFGTLGESVDFTGETLTHSGERVSTKPFVLGGLVTWATYIPEDNFCSTEGESNLYAVYYKTGTAYLDYIFREQRDVADAIAAADAAETAAIAAGDTAAAEAAAATASELRKSYEVGDVARVKKLGGKIGMPSTLSAGVTTSGTVKGFAGQSTGNIVEIEFDSPISLKSEIINWANRPIP